MKIFKGKTLVKTSFGEEAPIEMRVAPSKRSILSNLVYPIGKGYKVVGHADQKNFNWLLHNHFGLDMLDPEQYTRSRCFLGNKYVVEINDTLYYNADGLICIIEKLKE